jgi:hypothetical protein
MFQPLGRWVCGAIRLDKSSIWRYNVRIDIKGSRMDERAIQLYKQAVAFAYTTAGEDAGKGTIIEGLTAGKFAELILKECMDICDSTQAQYGQYTFTATTVKNRIKERFGVEE